MSAQMVPLIFRFATTTYAKTEQPITPLATTMSAQMARLIIRLALIQTHSAPMAQTLLATTTYAKTEQPITPLVTTFA